MVPKLHAKGTSFKGAAAYLLHDKDMSSSDDRVAWTHTRNLATENADVAWRVMAATAMDQARLKEEAGVKNTGRKSAKHVLHFSLSWHPDQDPSREEMIEAAEGSIAALGADNHQALVIAHTDEDHAHVHVVVNRVSPDDGRHLSSSKEKLKLSQWAQAYEEKTGIYCENRIVNNQMRKRGEYVRGQKDKARHIFEAQAGIIANDNAADQALAKAQAAKDHALALRGRNMAKIHAGQREQVRIDHKARRKGIMQDLNRAIGKARAKIVEDMRPAWVELNKRQAAERETFEGLEATFFGRASNMVRTVRISRSALGEENGIIKRTFGILTNAGQRKTYFERAQARARGALERVQADKVSEARKALTTEYRAKLAANRAVFSETRADVRARQVVEREALKSDWKTRTAERTAAYEDHARKREASQQMRGAYASNSKPPAPALDPEAAKLKAKYGDVFEGATKRRAHEQDNKRDFGNEDDS